MASAPTAIRHGESGGVRKTRAGGPKVDRSEGTSERQHASRPQLRRGQVECFDLEAVAQSGLNANVPAEAAGIGNLALRARARADYRFSLELQCTKFHLVSG